MKRILLGLLVLAGLGISQVGGARPLKERPPSLVRRAAALPNSIPAA